MIPTLFHLGPFRVHIYGLMLALSFVVGSWWAMKAAGRRGIPEDRIFSLVAWILVSSIAGARLHFVLAHPDSYGDPLHLFRIWEGGLTLYGGLISAVVVSFLYLRRHRLGFLPVADATAPALALGEGLTRIGCFLNGCCFGRAHEGFLCVHYPLDSYSVHAQGDLCVYPSQLLLSGAMLILFLLLRRIDRARPASGVLFGIYLLGQGLVRYAIDFTRFYEEVDRVRAFGPWIETESQLVALALAFLGVAVLAQRLRSRDREAPKKEGG